MELLEVEVWVKVDANGDYEVGTNEDEAKERFDENIGSDLLHRFVKVKVRLPVPKPVEVTVKVPDEPTAASVQVA